MSDSIKNRYDIVYFFDISDGNPNGDPDAGNLPRLDPETGQGLVTDVCIKRKIRNYVELHSSAENMENVRIFVRERAILNQQIEEAYFQSPEVKKAVADWAEYEKAKKDKKVKVKPDAPKIPFEDVARRWMCEQFFDIRTFGAVMTTGKEKDDSETESKIRRTAGQVRGPVQFSFARSIHPIISQEHALTVCAARMEEKSVEEQIGIQGRKFTVPYALYLAHAYVNPTLAAGENGTGFSETDLELFKKALDMMFEQDKSAARANMKPVACIAFKHDNALGNARADQLFSRVTCKPKDGVQALPNDDNESSGEGRPPRSFEDYKLKVNDADLPAGVTIERWINWE